MGLFEDLTRFLETRLEEFLKAHPELELQALDEQLRQQEQDTVRLITEGKTQERQLQASILKVAEEIKIWHLRVEKAMRANRPDLAERARDREAALLNQGNQLWGQMKGAKERIQQMETLRQQIKQRRQEIKAKLDTVRAQQQAADTGQWSGWTKPSSNWDDLEREFHELEVEEEMRNLRRKS